ncbi:hypothetical protein [Pseudomonas sp. TWI929]|uniref:hypothetical protein n=1 Tax=Pseudomonas sp. TWI929 TaxID=3136795 RepID=UPI00320869E1
MNKAILLVIASLALAGCASQPQQALTRDPRVASTPSGPENPYSPGTVIVVATPGFEWAAQNVAQVINAEAVAPKVSWFAARNLALYNENVVGVVEVSVDVDNIFESVSAVCRDKETTAVWKETRILNFAGGRDRLARDMVGALVTKVSGKPCPL